MQCHSPLHSAHGTALCSTVQCNAVQFTAIQYSMKQHSTVQSIPGNPAPASRGPPRSHPPRLLPLPLRYTAGRSSASSGRGGIRGSGDGVEGEGGRGLRAASACPGPGPGGRRARGVPGPMQRSPGAARSGAAGVKVSFMAPRDCLHKPPTLLHCTVVLGRLAASGKA